MGKQRTQGHRVCLAVQLAPASHTLTACIARTNLEMDGQAELRWLTDYSQSTDVRNKIKRSTE